MSQPEKTYLHRYALIFLFPRKFYSLSLFKLVNITMETDAIELAKQVVKQTSNEETKIELVFDSIQSYHATSLDQPSVAIKATTKLDMSLTDGRWIITQHEDVWYGTFFNLSGKSIHG
jgi:hypothetical protein